MKALYTTSTALGHGIYPLTGAFQRLAGSVQPEVYQLFGQVLVMMSSKTGEFATVAQGAGRVVDELGARFVAAVTAGNGLGGFMKNAVSDLSELGDVTFNFFGALGNILKVMPGYAEDLLGVLDGLSKAFEAITASPITQFLVQSFLYFHGFTLWVGLAASATVVLGNALVGLAAKLGLAEAGALAFNAEQFGMGIRAMWVGVVSLGEALVTLDGDLAVTAATSGVLAGAFTALSAINPLVWIGAAIGAVAFLVYELARGTTYVDAYRESVQKAFASLPVSQAGVDMTIAQADAVRNLAAATAAYHAANTVQSHAALVALGQVLDGTGQLSAAQVALANKVLEAGSAMGDQQVKLSVLTADQKSYSSLLKVTGGNLSLLTDAGFTWSQWVNSSGSGRQQMIIQITAMADAYRALAIGIGRAGAANNAQDNQFMTSTLPMMQQVTKAEDAVITAILSGRQAFTTFEQDLAQTGTAAQAAGAHLSGLNANSLTLANDFYSTLLPAGQKLIDSLQQQMVSTRSLSTAVADEARQMLPFAQHNAEARSVIVDLINNALGPGTVSLKTLDGWVRQNSSSMRGFNALVAQATVNAGNLASTLAGLLNEQFRQDLLVTSGASAMMKQYASDLDHAGTSATQTAGDRAALIKDLENTSFSARQATSYVDGLTTSITKVPPYVHTTVVLNGIGEALSQLQAYDALLSRANGGLGVAGAGVGVLKNPPPGATPRLPAVIAPGAGGGGGAMHVTVPVTLTTGGGGAPEQGLASPQYLQGLQRAVQEAVLRYGKLNPDNGLATAGGWG
jgi:hypothetical protein